ncbi:hypothetical protein C8R46DRAFT_1211463 [Mycena filopes]|nr:hypothetical protein C8R46DRAFT_1211463 [Mycena filopes]
MRIHFAVFISLALVIPTLAAPVVRDVQDVAGRIANESEMSTDTVFARDESALEVRAKVKAKAPVKAKPAAKPIAKPPLKAPAKVAPKPAKPAAKPVARPPVKAPIKPAAKSPVKPAAKPAPKPPVKPAKPLVKARAKPPVTAAAKAPAKAPAKPPAKPPTKPAVKPPAKAPVKPGPHQSFPASGKTFRKEANGVERSARPIKGNESSILPLPGSKTKKPTSSKISRRTLSTTQFHATCKNFASSIQSKVQAGTFTLQPDRIFPNEFTWSGGFYITPDEDKAQLFGATFLADKCASLGGTVVMEFNFDSSALKVNNIGTTTSVVNTFQANQGRLGQAIIRFLKRQVQTTAAAPDPPTDNGISQDDNPAPSTPAVQIPTQDQVEAFLTDRVFNTQNKAALAAMKDVDVVAGAGLLTPSQRVAIEDAGNAAVGIPPLKEPFNQVVLVTDKGKQSLSLRTL